MDNKILIVAKREYLERVRTRAFVVMTLLVPVLMSLVLLFPLYMSAKSSGPSASVRRIRILDATGAGVGDRIAQNLRADTSLADTVEGPFVVAVSPAELPAAEKTAEQEVMKPKSLQGYLVVDDSTLTGKRAKYFGRNAATISDMEDRKSVV